MAKQTKQTPEAPATETKVRGKHAALRAQRIKLLVEGNPKRKNSKARKRFDLYQDGQTVQEFLNAGGTMADILWDREAHKQGGPFIELVE